MPSCQILTFEETHGVVVLLPGLSGNLQLQLLAAVIWLLVCVLQWQQVVVILLHTIHVSKLCERVH